MAAILCHVFRLVMALSMILIRFTVNRNSTQSGSHFFQTEATFFEPFSSRYSWDWRSIEKSWSAFFNFGSNWFRRAHCSRSPGKSQTIPGLKFAGFGFKPTEEACSEGMVSPRQSRNLQYGSVWISMQHIGPQPYVPKPGTASICMPLHATALACHHKDIHLDKIGACPIMQ